MRWLLNLPVAIWRRCLLVGQGLAALVMLAVTAAGALFDSKGSVASRIGAALTSPTSQRRAFALLRLIQPNLVINRQLVSAYANNGTAVVTRRADVIDILARDDDFGVVYAPRMEMITGGENFFLGMQNTPRYTLDVSNMRLAVRREDVATTVAPFIDVTARSLVDTAPGRIDVPASLSLPTAARLLDHYFGTPGPSEADIIEWTTTLFWYLFIDLKADPALDMKAVGTAIAFREWLDDLIASRKATGDLRDDVLGRCLAMQAGGMPGMSDQDIRNNLIGLLIGELPTTSACVSLALDELLNRPGALAGASRAAREGNDAALAAHVFEALRFRPLNPVIYRRALRDCVVSDGSLRARRVRKGTMVFASNLSAMFDPLIIADANTFRTDRSWDTYMLWGSGLHTCFGAYLNRVTIPGILKPLLTKNRLRRASGQQGQIDQQGTPFPVHFNVEFDI